MSFCGFGWTEKNGWLLFLLAQLQYVPNCGNLVRAEPGVHCNSLKWRKSIFVASWRRPSFVAGSSGPEWSLDQGGPATSLARKAVWGWGFVALWWRRVGSVAADASCSSPFPSGGCWLSPRSAPAARESWPSPPPRTEPSALWSTSADRDRGVRVRVRVSARSHHLVYYLQWLLNGIPFSGLSTWILILNVSMLIK